MSVARTAGVVDEKQLGSDKPLASDGCDGAQLARVL
jgi:hypothetical protein